MSGPLRAERLRRDRSPAVTDDEAGWTVVAATVAAVVGGFPPTVGERVPASAETRRQRPRVLGSGRSAEKMLDAVAVRVAGGEHGLASFLDRWPAGHLELDAEEALRTFDVHDGAWGRLQAIDDLAALAEITGDHPEAERLHGEAFRAAEELDLRPDAAHHLTGPGRIAPLTGDLAAAEDLRRRALALATAQVNTYGQQFAEIGLGLVARRAGRRGRYTAKGSTCPAAPVTRGRAGAVRIAADDGGDG